MITCRAEDFWGAPMTIKVLSKPTQSGYGERRAHNVRFDVDAPHGDSLGAVVIEFSFPASHGTTSVRIEIGPDSFSGLAAAMMLAGPKAAIKSFGGALQMDIHAK